jgi:biopolymer transport protein ExbB
VPGAVVTVGPLTFFAAADGSPAGPAATQPGRLAPTLLPGLSAPDMDAVATLVRDGSATVPVDVTPGMDAAHLDQDADSLVEQVRKGGMVMLPLLAVGLIAVIITLWKLVELRTYCVRDGGIVARVLDRLQAGDEAAALREAATLKPPLGELLRDGIAHRHAPHEHLEEILHEHVMAAVPRLERHLGTLAVLAGVAPLLGLLGTVTGMIHTFQLVTLFGTGEARVLSGGISEALITTKFGLSIAIPALLAHAFLARRARTLAGELESSAMTFVAHLKRGGPADG